MKISIITAVLNGENVIARTLDSVRSQAHADIEHIVIDGQSADQTLQIVREQGSRVARVVCERDTGVYDALNKGLAVATGEVILCLNAGDVYTDNDVLSRYTQAFEDESVEVVFGDVLMTDPLDLSRVVRRYRSGTYQSHDLARGLMPPHPTLALRSRTYQRFGGYDAGFRIAGDFDLCLRVLLRGQVPARHLDHYLVRMPIGGMSNRSLLTTLENTSEMYRACRQQGVETSWLRLLSRLPAKWLEGRDSD